MKMRMFSKKTLALFLTLTMLMSCMVWSAVSAATTYTCDFEGYVNQGVGDQSDQATVNAIATVESTQYEGHGQVMKLAYDANTAATSGTVGFRYYYNNGGAAYTKYDANALGHGGKTALVTLDYKVVKSGATTFDLKVAGAGIYWGSGYVDNATNNAAGQLATIDYGAAATEWKTVSAITTIGGSGIHVYLKGQNAANATGAEVLIDNVRVIVDYVKPQVTFDYGYDSKQESQTGITGDAVVFPATPVRDGYVFKGWVDANDQPVTSATFGDSGTTVTYTATWEKMALIYTSDFEGYVNQGVGDQSDQATVNAIATVESTQYEGHGQVMKLAYDANTAATSGTVGFRYYYNNGGATYTKYDAGTLGHSGKKVLVTLDYKVVKGGATDFDLYAVGAGLYWGSGYVDSTANAAAGKLATIANGAAATEWKTVSAVTTIGGSGIHVYLKGQNAANATGAEVLIDNVRVVVDYVDTKVVLDYGYDSKTETLFGLTGDAVALPAAPVRDGYEFKGWVDANDLPVTSASFGVAGTTVTYTATWEEVLPGYICDFEGYVNQGAGDQSATDSVHALATVESTQYEGHGQVMKLAYEADTASTSGAVGFRYYFNNGGAAYTKYDASALGHTGKTALVTLDYKVVKSGATTFDLYAAGAGIYWGYPDVSANAVPAPGKLATIAYGAEATEWKTVSAVVPINGSGIHVYLKGQNAANATGAEVLIDNVRVVVDYVETKVVFDYAYDSKTETLFGLTGDAVVFPENVVRKGYTLLGWFDTNDQEVTSATFGAAGSTVTYTAKWDDKLPDISSAFQYVGGQGKDNLGATAGSTLYDLGQGVRTAFRVGATYVTETENEDMNTLVLNGETYTIKERGMLLGSVAKLNGREMTVATTQNEGLIQKVSVNSDFNRYWKYNNGTVTYTILVSNVTKEIAPVEFVARSYVVVDVEGEDRYIYSDTSVSFSSQSIYEAALEQNPNLDWFE